MNIILTQTLAGQRAEALRAEAEATRQARLAAPARAQRPTRKFRALFVRLRLA